MSHEYLPEALETLSEVSGVEDASPETRFDELGLDSLQMIEWLSALEEKVDAEFNIQNLNFSEFSGRSIGDVVALLRERSTSPSAS
jgi:acyl carrier protein